MPLNHSEARQTGTDMETRAKKRWMTLVIVSGLAIIFLSFVVSVGILVLLASKHRGGRWFQALRHFEELQNVTVPSNIDEAGIKALVNDLLPGGKAEFAERKLRLLEQRAVPALLEALDDPRFLAKPKKSDSLYQRAPFET